MSTSKPNLPFLPGKRCEALFQAIRLRLEHVVHRGRGRRELRLCLERFDFLPEFTLVGEVRANCLRSAAESECWLPLSNGFIVPLDDVRDLIPAAQDDTDAPPKDDESASETEPEESRRADLLFVFVPPVDASNFASPKSNTAGTSPWPAPLRSWTWSSPKPPP